ncbi:MAG: hypothetical protein LRY55_06720 [Leadbetterella sp.]|nr:hypothetical protein [Leadbetterella sp.]
MRLILSILLVLGYSLAQGQKAESIYVHTDKETYFPGEILWYKIYTVHTEDLTPVRTGSVAYLDLTDSRGNSVLQAKTETGPATRNGGSVFIPQRLASGTYILTGSTLLSEAGGRSFSKKITVLNPFAILDTLALPPKNTYMLSLFPEGGTLVSGIETRIGYKVSDAYGKGVKASLTLPDGTASVSNAFGIGSFRIKPAAGVTVKVNLPDGQELTRPLPAVSESGYVLNAEDKGDHYIIKVAANANRAGETLTLVSGSPYGSPVKHHVILNTAGAAAHMIPTDRLPEGSSPPHAFQSRRYPRGGKNSLPDPGKGAATEAGAQ